MTKIYLSKKTEQSDKETKQDSQTPVDPEQELSFLSKIAEGKPLEVYEFEILLRKVSQEIKSFKEQKNKSVMEYVADKIGISTTSLNSYLVTSYGLFNKDLENKVHPYIAFSIAIIHALNLARVLGELIGKQHGNTANTIKTKS
jgi:hypothetical protein